MSDIKNSGNNVFKKKSTEIKKNEGIEYPADGNIKDFDKKYCLNSHNIKYSVPISVRFGINCNYLRFYSNDIGQSTNLTDCKLQPDFGGGLNLGVDWLVTKKGAAHRLGFFPRLGIRVSYFDFDHWLGRHAMEGVLSGGTVLGRVLLVTCRDLGVALLDVGIGIFNGGGHLITGIINIFKTVPSAFSSIGYKKGFFDYKIRNALNNRFNGESTSHFGSYGYHPLAKDQYYLQYFNGIANLIAYFEPEVDRDGRFRIIPQLGVGATLFAVTKNYRKYDKNNLNNNVKLYETMIDPIFSFKLILKTRIAKSWDIILETGYTYNPLLFLRQDDRKIIGGIKNFIFAINGNYTFYEGRETIKWFNDNNVYDLKRRYATYVGINGFVCGEYKCMDASLSSRVVAPFYTGGLGLNICSPFLFKVSKVHSFGLFLTVECQYSKLKKYKNGNPGNPVLGIPPTGGRGLDKNLIDCTCVIFGLSHSFDYKILRIDNRFGFYLIGDGEILGRKVICRYLRTIRGTLGMPFFGKWERFFLIGRLRYSISANIKVLELFGIKSKISKYFYISMGANTNIVDFVNDWRDGSLEYFKVENFYLGLGIRVI